MITRLCRRCRVGCRLSRLGYCAKCTRVHEAAAQREVVAEPAVELVQDAAS